MCVWGGDLGSLVSLSLRSHVPVSCWGFLSVLALPPVVRELGKTIPFSLLQEQRDGWFVPSLGLSVLMGTGFVTLPSVA